MSKAIITFLLCLISINSESQIDGHIGIYVKNLSVYQRDGVFKADLYWWIKLPNVSNKKLLKEYAKIEFVNGTEIINTIVEERDTSNYYYVTGYYKGEFTFDPDYKNYPIDIQNLPIIIESVNLTEDYVHLVPDNNASTKSAFPIALEKDIVIPGFSIVDADYEKQSKIYESDFGDPDFSSQAKYSRITCLIKIERDSTSFILKILIPNLFLLVITYLVFFIPARNLEVAVGCTVTSLLASIALQLTINSNLPDIGYLTNADKLFHLFYLLITLALVQTVLTFNLEKNGKEVLSQRLEILGRIGFPILLALGLLIILN